MSGTLQEAQSFQYARLSMEKTPKNKPWLSKEEEAVLKDALQQGKAAEEFVWDMEQPDKCQAADTENAPSACRTGGRRGNDSGGENGKTERGTPVGQCCGRGKNMNIGQKERENGFSVSWSCA